MILQNSNTGGVLKLVSNDTQFGKNFSTSDDAFLTIALNNGAPQTVNIDGTIYDFPSHALIALMASQHYSFSNPKEVVAWQFNREFYCIIDHDVEVSCAGLLFYGSADQPTIQLDSLESNKIQLLYQVFIDEFAEKDNYQEGMLRMLLKRLIIKTTRLYKKHAHLMRVPAEELNTVRQYNLLVEKHFKQWHQVQDYANEMHKSPKTLSNLFAQCNTKSPLKILHERIILEAKRMLIYTDSTIKEIAYEIGFEEVPPFNRLFKKITNQTPSQFRNSV